MVYAIIIKDGEPKKKVSKNKEPILGGGKKIEKKKSTSLCKEGAANSSYCHKNNQYSILNYFDVKKKDKKKDQRHKEECTPKKNVDKYIDNFYSIEAYKNESKKDEHILTYIKWICEEKKNEKGNMKEHILKLLILLKKEDIYLKRYFPKVYNFEQRRKKERDASGKINCKEKIYVNNIYNRNVTRTKFYSNIVNDTLYEYKLTYCKENNLITFHFYDGLSKSFKLSSDTFFYLISDDKSVFRRSSLNNEGSSEEDTLLPHKNNYIYTFERNCENKISVQIIDVLSKTRKTELSLAYTPVRIFYHNDHLFFVNLLSSTNGRKYFTYSMYKNNVKEKIRVVYLSAVHPLYSNAVTRGNDYPFFRKCKYFHREERVFMWTDPLWQGSSRVSTAERPADSFTSSTLYSSSDSYTSVPKEPCEMRLNEIPNMNIIHINCNVNICIAFEENTETYFFFYILYNVVKYNKKYLRDYFKAEKMDKFLPFQHFLSIEKKQFSYKNETFRNINFNTEAYKPQLVITTGGNKSIQSRIKLCVYDNVNNLLFLIPIYHKYVKDKIKVVPNVLNFTTVNMTRDFSTLKYYPYNMCAFINNQMNTTHLECNPMERNYDHTIVNVSTGERRMHYFKRLLKQKREILKWNDGDTEKKDSRKNTQLNKLILDVNKMNHFIIILNKDGMLYLLSDDVYISSIYLYNNTAQIYNLHNSDLCHVTVDTIDYDNKKKLRLKSYRVHIDILPKNPTLKFVLYFFYNYICRKIATQFFTLCVYECRRGQQNRGIFHFLNIDIYFLDNHDLAYSHSGGAYPRSVKAQKVNEQCSNGQCSNGSSVNVWNANLQREPTQTQKCHLHESQQFGDIPRARSTWVKNQTEKYEMFNRNFFQVENLPHIEFSRFVYLFMLICVEDLKMYRKMEKYLYLKKGKNLIPPEEYTESKFNCFKFGQAEESSNSEEDHGSSSTSCDSDDRLAKKIHGRFFSRGGKMDKDVNVPPDSISKSYYTVINNFITYLHNKYKHIYRNKYLLLAYLHSYYDEISMSELVEEKIKDDIVFLILILSYTLKLYNFMFHYMSKLGSCRKRTLIPFYQHVCRMYYKEVLLKRCTYGIARQRIPLTVSESDRCSLKMKQRGDLICGRTHRSHSPLSKNGVIELGQDHKFDKYTFLNSYLKEKFIRLSRIPSTIEIISQIANCSHGEEGQSHLNHFLDATFFLQHNESHTKKLKMKYECYLKEVEQLFSVIMEEQDRRKMKLMKTKQMKKGKYNQSRITNITTSESHIADCYENFQSFKSLILVNNKMKFLYYFSPLYFPLRNLLIASHLSLLYGQNLKKEIIKDNFLRNVVKNELDVIYVPAFPVNFMESAKDKKFQGRRNSCANNSPCTEVQKGREIYGRHSKYRNQYNRCKIAAITSKQGKKIPHDGNPLEKPENNNGTSRYAFSQHSKKQQRSNDLYFYQKQFQFHASNIKYFDSLNIDDVNLVNILLKCVFYENLYALNRYSYMLYMNLQNVTHVMLSDLTGRHVLRDALFWDGHKRRDEREESKKCSKHGLIPSKDGLPMEMIKLLDCYENFNFKNANFYMSINREDLYFNKCFDSTNITVKKNFYQVLDILNRSFQSALLNDGLLHRYGKDACGKEKHDSRNEEKWKRDQNNNSYDKKNIIVQKSYLSEYKILKDCCFFFDTFKMDRNISSCYFPHNKDPVLVYLNNFHNYYFSKYYKKRKIQLLKDKEDNIEEDAEDEGRRQNGDLIDLIDLENSSDSLESAYIHKHKYNRKNVNRNLKKIIKLLNLDKLEEKKILIDTKINGNIDKVLDLMHLYYTLEKFYKMKYICMFNISEINFFDIINSIHYKPEINFNIKYDLYVYLFEYKQNQSRLSNISIPPTDSFSLNVPSRAYSRDPVDGSNRRPSATFYNYANSLNENGFPLNGEVNNGTNRADMNLPNRGIEMNGNDGVSGPYPVASHSSSNPAGLSPRNNTLGTGYPNGAPTTSIPRRNSNILIRENSENEIQNVHLSNAASYHYTRFDNNQNNINRNVGSNMRFNTDTFNEPSELTMLNRRIREFNSYWHMRTNDLRTNNNLNYRSLLNTSRSMQREGSNSGNRFSYNQNRTPERSTGNAIYRNYGNHLNVLPLNGRVGNYRDAGRTTSYNVSRNVSTSMEESPPISHFENSPVYSQRRNGNQEGIHNEGADHNGQNDYGGQNDDSMHLARERSFLPFNIAPSNNTNQRDKLHNLKYSLKKKKKKHINRIKLNVNSLLNSLNVHMKTDKIEKIFILNKKLKELQDCKNVLRNFNNIPMRELANKIGVPASTHTGDFFDNLQFNNSTSQNILTHRDSLRNNEMDNNQAAVQNDVQDSTSSSSYQESDYNSDFNKTWQVPECVNSPKSVIDVEGDGENGHPNRDDQDGGPSNVPGDDAIERINNYSNKIHSSTYNRNGNDSSNDEFYSSNFLYTPNKAANEMTGQNKMNDISFDNINRRYSCNMSINDTEPRRDSQISFLYYDRRNSFMVNSLPRRESNLSLPVLNGIDSNLNGGTGRHSSGGVDRVNYAGGDDRRVDRVAANRPSINSSRSMRNSTVSSVIQRERTHQVSDAMSSYNNTPMEEYANNLYDVNDFRNKKKLNKKIDYYDFTFDKAKLIKYNNFVNSKIRNAFKLQCSLCQTILYKKYDDMQKKKNSVLVKIINHENYLFKFLNKNYKYCGMYFLAGLIYGLGLLQFFKSLKISLFLQYILKYKNRCLYICSILGISLSLISSKNQELTSICLSALFKELYDGKRKLNLDSLLFQCFNEHENRDDNYKFVFYKKKKISKTHKIDTEIEHLKNGGCVKRGADSRHADPGEDSHYFNLLYAHDNELSDEDTSTVPMTSDDESSLSCNTLDRNIGSGIGNPLDGSTSYQQHDEGHAEEAIYSITGGSTDVNYYPNGHSNADPGMLIRADTPQNGDPGVKQDDHEGSLKEDYDWGAKQEYSDRAYKLEYDKANRPHYDLTDRQGEGREHLNERVDPAEERASHYTCQTGKGAEVDPFSDKFSEEWEERNEYMRQYICDRGGKEDDVDPKDDEEQSIQDDIGDDKKDCPDDYRFGNFLHGNPENRADNINEVYSLMNSPICNSICSENSQEKKKNKRENHKWQKMKKDSRKKKKSLDNLVLSTNFLCLGYLHMNSSNKCLTRYIFKLLQKSNLSKLNLLCIFWSIGSINFKKGSLFHTIIISLLYFINANVPYKMHKNDFIKSFSMKSLHADDMSYDIMHIIISSALAVSLSFFRSNNIHAFNMIFMPSIMEHIYYFNHYEIMVKSFARNMIMFDFVDLSHEYILSNIPLFLRVLPNDWSRRKKGKLPYMYLINKNGTFKDKEVERKLILLNGHLNMDHDFVRNEMNRIYEGGQYFRLSKQNFVHCYRDKLSPGGAPLRYYFHGGNSVVNGIRGLHEGGTHTRSNEGVDCARTYVEDTSSDQQINTERRNHEHNLLKDYTFVYNCEMLRYYIIMGVLQVLSLKYLSTHHEHFKKICFEYISYFENINKGIYAKKKLDKLYKKVNYLVQKIKDKVMRENLLQDLLPDVQDVAREASANNSQEGVSKSGMIQQMEGERLSGRERQVRVSDSINGQLCSDGAEDHQHHDDHHDEDDTYMDPRHSHEEERHGDLDTQINNHLHDFIAHLQYDDSSSDSENEKRKIDSSHVRKGNGADALTQEGGMEKQSADSTNIMVTTSTKKKNSVYSHIYKLILKYVKKIKKIKKCLQNWYSPVEDENYITSRLLGQKYPNEENHLYKIKEEDVNDIVNLIYQCLSLVFVGSCDKSLNKKIKNKINNLVNIRDKNTNNLYYYYLGYINLGCGKYVLKKHTDVSTCTLTLILFSFFHIYDLSSHFIIHLIEFMYVLLIDKRFLKIYDVTSNQFVNLPIQLIYKEKVSTYHLKASRENHKEVSSKIQGNALNRNLYLHKTNYTSLNRKVILSPSAIPHLDIVNISIVNNEYYHLSFSCLDAKGKKRNLSPGAMGKDPQTDSHICELKSGRHITPEHQCDKNNIVRKIIKRGILFVKRREYNCVPLDYKHLLIAEKLRGLCEGYEKMAMNVVPSENTTRNSKTRRGTSHRNTTNFPGINQPNGKHINTAALCLEELYPMSKENSLVMNQKEFFPEIAEKKNILRNTLMRHKDSESSIGKFLLEVLKHYEKIPLTFSDDTMLLFQTKGNYTHKNISELLMLKYYIKLDEEKSSWEETHHDDHLVTEGKFAKLFLLLNEQFSRQFIEIEKLNKQNRRKKVQFLPLIYAVIVNYYERKWSSQWGKQILSSAHSEEYIKMVDAFCSNVNIADITGDNGEDNKDDLITTHAMSPAPIIINNIYNNERAQNNIYTFYYKIREKKENIVLSDFNLLNQLNQLLVQYALKKLKTFMKYQLVKQVQNNFDYFLLVQNLHIDRSVNYLYFLSDVYHSFYPFYQFFYKYWEDNYYGALASPRRREKKSICDLEFFDYVANPERDTKFIVIGEGVGQRGDLPAYSFPQKSSSSYILRFPQRNKKKGYRAGGRTERGCTSCKVRVTWMDEAETDVSWKEESGKNISWKDEVEKNEAIPSDGTFDKVKDLLSLNFDYLKIMQGMYKRSSTRVSLMSYLPFLSTDYHFVYFFENNVKVIKRIFQQYYNKGYPHKSILFNKRKISTKDSGNVINLFTQYCNFPNYFSFWNIVLSDKEDNVLFVPQGRHLYDHKYNKYIRSVISKADQVLTHNNMLQGEMMGKKHKHIYAKVSNRNKVNCGYLNASRENAFPSRGTVPRNGEIALHRKRRHIKIAFKWIDKRNSPSAGRVYTEEKYHPFVILQRIAHTIERNRENEVHPIRQAFIENTHGKTSLGAYNFFKQWISTSEQLSSKLVTTHNISLNSACINSFFTDILLCFFIGNL
ncbi:conserved Plasmodium protein, unknown function [Plasmodium knowlesi strain H]|uniref:Uncharacterized protein n=3 Tax=Plasmodium knowlesi TaxID=5850 RepID=A0A5K1U9N8_PLAKH|nr:anaphase-promoting complex subunit 1, putative [Plasmodium knowlesi strain H]OTN66262.1 Uncharacterized protein PKNOH_S09522500 [Plasmodium knowlesi]CAA9986393.1 anaphase-promoting complex subunit 1, putative [Plasmodium knowlesi strain H]SBO25663.1 conserved Plasmodium protein, unknown function [Plasmodium knowlesi strain H]SBO28378.1 conserved Plasmodium protein, unknown function [Plasmodium knowlesi strain H]VVS75867.1 anaphase-promoting complex subunit 1, putative [Plasmodium knowlesi s|eukprot:XP_002257799.1 hypothetical protein, conserved in Plasmodium species [Plasmodium knowlesi strain H]